jgi:hypothetical protein
VQKHVQGEYPLSETLQNTSDFRLLQVRITCVCVYIHIYQGILQTGPKPRQKIHLYFRYTLHTQSEGNFSAPRKYFDCNLSYKPGVEFFLLKYDVRAQKASDFEYFRFSN